MDCEKVCLGIRKGGNRGGEARRAHGGGKKTTRGALKVKMGPIEDSFRQNRIEKAGRSNAGGEKRKKSGVSSREKKKKVSAAGGS